uniref:SFRICE_025652 n=1 Tax=Spodoptera frugiperda TaxID=7108 RepID=A0A2H1WIU4_SPOFR
MFQYEYEKRPPSSVSCDTATTVATDWTRRYPTVPERVPNARRPLPPRPTVIHRVPDKTIVPLKVWIIASASCFAVCAALVLATVVITKWDTSETFTTREVFQSPEPIRVEEQQPTTYQEQRVTEDTAVLEKLSIFKNFVPNREHKSLIMKPQIHPVHDDIIHEERPIKKKDRPEIGVPPEIHDLDADKEIQEPNNHIADKFEVNETKVNVVNDFVPNFKPILSNFGKSIDAEIPYGFLDGKDDYFYNDENLYDDYMQSNSMTSYLIEKVQELHEWVSTDPDITANQTRQDNDFGSVLKALNESLVEGNITIVMHKLRDMYFGENYTHFNNSRKVIVTNSTDLLSFGILTLDVMLLHNIQLMAWENQELARTKMMQDPDVFAFNALFLDPSKVEMKQNEIAHDGSLFLKRLNPRQDPIEDLDIGKNLLENIMEVGMSTARAAIHLGRAYKNTKNILNQISNKEQQAASIQNQMSRNIDGNTHALNHLQTSFDSTHGVASNGSFYTELDCVWLLYCRNLAATTKLNAPYGTMARINGVALRMLTGELPANKALDTLLYEVLTGWTELKCNDMFPRCSKVNAASIVLDTIMQSHRKSQVTNRGR